MNHGGKRRPDTPDMKTRIFDVSVDLFAKKGFHNVSMRQIADTVGITAGAIYHHYPSKDDILDDVFDYYMRNRMNSLPRLDDILAYVGTEPPAATLARTVAVYPPSILPTMSKALRIAENMNSLNRRAAFIIDDVVNMASDYAQPILQKMLDMDLIEPINVEYFSTLYTSFCFAAAVRHYEDRSITTADYEGCLKMLFDLVREKQAA